MTKTGTTVQGNEDKTALILMIAVLSEKMTELISKLAEMNRKLDCVKSLLEKKQKENDSTKEKKYYAPLTAEDYD
jgi:hypothetical protein